MPVMPRFFAQEAPGARGTLWCAAYPSLRAMRQWRPACLGLRYRAARDDNDASALRARGTLGKRDPLVR
eukprot:5752217-Pyramimonas_sp.AAC.1